MTGIKGRRAFTESSLLNPNLIDSKSKRRKLQFEESGEKDEVWGSSAEAFSLWWWMVVEERYVADVTLPLPLKAYLVVRLPPVFNAPLRFPAVVVVVP